MSNCVIFSASFSKGGFRCNFCAVALVETFRTWQSDRWMDFKVKSEKLLFCHLFAATIKVQFVICICFFFRSIPIFSLSSGSIIFVNFESRGQFMFVHLLDTIHNKNCFCIVMILYPGEKFGAIECRVPRKVLKIHNSLNSIN